MAPHALDVAAAVSRALDAGGPVVALESAVFSHGLPPADGLRLAGRLDDVIVGVGALSALVAVRQGRIQVGHSLRDIGFLHEPDVLKVAARDLAVVMARRLSGGTTVAATLAVADTCGIHVMATGGIGGVHLGASWDESADLQALSRHPLIVVCAGAKVICDMGRTVEALDTLGVTLVGYQTDTFPAFIVRSSGVPIPHRVEAAAEIAAVALAKTDLGDRSALLVVQPPPVDAALDQQTVDEVLTVALSQAEAEGIGGAALTPYLLAAIAAATGGQSLRANLALLEANARLAAEIAVALTAAHRGRSRPVHHPA